MKPRTLYSCLLGMILTSPLVAYTEADFAPTPYVWSLGFCFDADVKPILDFGCSRYIVFMEDRLVYNTEHYLQNIHDGDIVWVHADKLPQFFEEVLPRLEVACIVVAGGSDATFPSELPFKQPIDDYLLSDKIIHLFVQNCGYSGNTDKVSPIPIGLDFHTEAYWPERHALKRSLSPKEQATLLQQTLQRLAPTKNRSKFALFDFAFSDSMRSSYQRHKMFGGEDRLMIRDIVVAAGIGNHLSHYVPHDELLRMKGGSAFDVSPPGNGIDCHRTWESLVLGCITIVRKSCLDPLFEGLPVILVDDWHSLTREKLDEYLDQYGDAFENASYREKLTHAYWMNKIRSVQKAYRLTKAKES